MNRAHARNAPRYTFWHHAVIGQASSLLGLAILALREWTLGGVFILVPVYALLFRTRGSYLFAAVSSLAALCRGQFARGLDRGGRMDGERFRARIFRPPGHCRHA